MSEYSVRRGDTLTSIAERHHTTAARLASLNHLRNANLIHVGEHLELPGDGFEAPKKKEPAKHAPAKHSPAKHSPAKHVGGGVHASSTMQRLAEDARSTALHMGGYRSGGRCAAGVSRAIHEAMGVSVHGNANQLDHTLPPSKFREVHMTLAQALKIPGLVLVWQHTSTRLGRLYGHTAITLGDGHSSASDYVERETLAASGGRTGLRIYEPI